MWVNSLFRFLPPVFFPLFTLVCVVSSCISFCPVSRFFSFASEFRVCLPEWTRQCSRLSFAVHFPPVLLFFGSCCACVVLRSSHRTSAHKRILTCLWWWHIYLLPMTCNDDNILSSHQPGSWGHGSSEFSKVWLFFSSCLHAEYQRHLFFSFFSFSSSSFRGDLSPIPVFDADANLRDAWIHRYVFNTRTRTFQSARHDLISIDSTNLENDVEIQDRVLFWNKLLTPSGLDPDFNRIKSLLELPRLLHFIHSSHLSFFMSLSVILSFLLVCLSSSLFDVFQSLLIC